jgi:hypothetical protein
MKKRRVDDGTFATTQQERSNNKNIDPRERE